MSSFSFDKFLSPDAGETPQQEQEKQEGPAAQWGDPLPFVVARERMISDASPWVMSAVRRGVEFCVAAAALLVLMPLLGFAAALVWMDSEGPIVFRQQRTGRGGRVFTLYKFRSMKAEACSSSPITARGDRRITRAGAFLRRHKLDELPQFWNVLRGDMGLVGPRPKLPHLEPLHMTYRPGITGAATLAFRDEEALLSGLAPDEVERFYENFIKPAKARLDMDYMNSATFRSDLRILWRTFASCLGRAQERQDVAEVLMITGAPIGECPAPSAAGQEN